ncbi:MULTISPECIES: serine hydrolase domain-containing protein [Streptomyces]|uniref:serine hydrolase domain-containing protein n=1 Tax=Streptomyces TaxID=1883 RepID=UPI0015874553|nr:serine hydrolase domain-containing protein [Streptomyces sp. CAI-85]MBO7936735.1 beta-lactamase family protein [Streptomyces sp. S9]NUV61145.1 beta-lactamase family protein [Streptomyces sp. CAI-85]
MDRVGAWLRARLPGLLTEWGVPGAAVAVGVSERVAESVAGVLSAATGMRATVDSLFQIGSITKVVTATLLMQLADEGKLDLDAPVRDVLPEYRIADAEAARRITQRQLLGHVTGFEGDVFTDRLGLPATATPTQLREAAVALSARWAALASHPRHTTRSAATTLQRACDDILHTLDSHQQQF